jgi:hypothetical protein
MRYTGWSLVASAEAVLGVCQTDCRTSGACPHIYIRVHWHIAHISRGVPLNSSGGFVHPATLIAVPGSVCQLCNPQPFRAAAKSPMASTRSFLPLAAVMLLALMAQQASAAFPTTQGLRFNGYDMVSDVTGYRCVSEWNCCRSSTACSRCKYVLAACGGLTCAITGCRLRAAT